jgi:hypothetical protein
MTFPGFFLMLLVCWSIGIMITYLPETIKDLINDWRNIRRGS